MNVAENVSLVVSDLVKKKKKKLQQNWRQKDKQKLLAASLISGPRLSLCFAE